MTLEAINPQAEEHSRCASSESYWIGIAVIAIEGGGVKVHFGPISPQTFCCK